MLDTNARRIHSNHVRDNLRERSFAALTLRRCSSRSDNAAIGAELDRSAFPALTARFDINGETNTADFSLPAPAFAFCNEIVITGALKRSLQ
jgi:hypothetical protein